MESTKKGLYALAAFTFIYVAISVPAMINHYKPKSYVEIDGKKYTENDLKSDKYASSLNKIKKEYLNNLEQVFQQFAQEKILELEAESKKKSVEDLVNESVSSYSPSREEVVAVYEQYKSRFPDKKIEEVEPSIVGYLKNMKEQEFYREIVSRYKVDINMEKVNSIRQKVEEKNNPALGPVGAKVTVIEFSDFECPFCNRSQGVNAELRKKYEGKIRWVFRDFPLPFHQNAMSAHIAANCAIPQNKYWDYFSLLFENSGNLSKENIAILADKAGLEKKAFNDCLANADSIKTEINSDLEDGRKLGVNGTPAFFINGIFVEGAQPQANFEKIIDEELSK